VTFSAFFFSKGCLNHLATAFCQGAISHNLENDRIQIFSSCLATVVFSQLYATPPKTFNSFVPKHSKGLYTQAAWSDLFTRRP